VRGEGRRRVERGDPVCDGGPPMPEYPGDGTPLNLPDSPGARNRQICLNSAVPPSIPRLHRGAVRPFFCGAGGRACDGPTLRRGDRLRRLSNVAFLDPLYERGRRGASQFPERRLIRGAAHNVAIRERVGPRNDNVVRETYNVRTMSVMRLWGNYPHGRMPFRSHQRTSFGRGNGMPAPYPSPNPFRISSNVFSMMRSSMPL
jgi:hypothetical protein